MFKSPFDMRDILGKNVFQGIKIVNGVDLRPKLRSVRNQKTTSMCCAFAVACIKELQENNDIGIMETFSPEYIYSKRETPVGMYGRDAMNILLKYGCCLEQSYPFQGKKESYAEEEAGHFKIDRYAKIETIEDCKKALSSECICVVSLPYYGKKIEFWKGEGNVELGHAVAIVGYNDVGFLIRNSWGESYGDLGYTILSYSDWGLIWDCYTAYDSKTIDFKKKEQVLNKKCCICS